MASVVLFIWLIHIFSIIALVWPPLLRHQRSVHACGLHTKRSNHGWSSLLCHEALQQAEWDSQKLLLINDLVRSAQMTRTNRLSIIPLDNKINRPKLTTTDTWMSYITLSTKHVLQCWNTNPIGNVLSFSFSLSRHIKRIDIFFYP